MKNNEMPAQSADRGQPPASVPECRLCSAANNADLAYSDPLWVIRHNPEPYGVAGWMVLQTRRHVAEVGDFSDSESAQFGRLLRSCLQTLKEVTGALRVYIAAFSEKTPHFHLHMVPRYANTPDGATGVELFDLARRAKAGEVHVNHEDVLRISEEFRSKFG